MRSAIPRCIGRSVPRPERRSRLRQEGVLVDDYLALPFWRPDEAYSVTVRRHRQKRAMARTAG
jgi:hypothetical protein